VLPDRTARVGLMHTGIYSNEGIAALGRIV
jgi:hypothetical protein